LEVIPSKNQATRGKIPAAYIYRLIGEQNLNKYCHIYYYWYWFRAKNGLIRNFSIQLSTRCPAGSASCQLTSIQNRPPNSDGIPSAAARVTREQPATVTETSRGEAEAKASLSPPPVMAPHSIRERCSICGAGRGDGWMHLFRAQLL